MSADKAVAQRDWVERVLGVSFAGSDADTSRERRWMAARLAWESASDTVDSQIAALQAALRTSGDDSLVEIAEFGLNGVTGGFKVPFMAALREVESTGLTPASASTLSKHVAAFRGHVQRDERVLVCDENPFGVAVSIRATLGAAFARLEAALAGI